MSKPAFALSAKKTTKRALDAAALAKAEARAQADVVTTNPAAPVPVAPTDHLASLLTPAASTRRAALHNTSLRMSEAQLDLLDSVFSRLPGVKSKQDLLIKLLMPALERLDRELPKAVAVVL